MAEFDRKEAAYRLRTYRHKAYYSLDRDDGLEHEAVFVALSPHELYERKVTMQELHAAISSLPDKQAKRIYAHFILGMTKKDIAPLLEEFSHRGLTWKADLIGRIFISYVKDGSFVHGVALGFPVEE